MLSKFSIINYFLISVCILFSLIKPSESNCVLDANVIRNEKGTFFYEMNGEWGLLRGHQVPTFSTLYLCCGESSEPTKVFKCSENGFDGETPNTGGYCSIGLSAWRETVETRDPNCKRSGVTYRVGFKVDISGSNRFFELYRSCYDKQTQTTMFVTHKAIYYRIAAPRPKYVSFSHDDLVEPGTLEMLQKSKVYETFKTLFGTNCYISKPNEQVFDFGHLVPAGDMMFASHKFSTFKMLNTRAQFHTINNQNWNTIECWVRSQLPKCISASTIIFTGAHGILELDNVKPGATQIFLGGPGVFPVPMYMYKIIPYPPPGCCLAFVTYNNIFYDYDKRPEPICKTVECPILLPENSMAGYTYCCEVRSLEKVVGHKFAQCC